MKHQKLITTPEISLRMSSVKLKKGECENQLARELWHRGIRYRRNYRGIPGSPDIAITKNKIAVFIDGEFWHGFDWETKKNAIKTNREYWIEKIEENMVRDIRNDSLLKQEGWIVIRFWERQVKKDLLGCVDTILAYIE